MVRGASRPVIIRCTKCSTEFALDPSQVGAEGVTLRCSVCSHMFHAEPDPGAAAPPWRVQTADGMRFTVADLRRVLEQAEDGRLRPDDQVSRTGDTWIRLGEMPEFSSLFIGAEGLPRVFRAVESSPAGDLGPPPAFGAGVDEVRREETVRFNLASIAGSQAGPLARRPPPHPSQSSSGASGSRPHPEELAARAAGVRHRAAGPAGVRHPGVASRPRRGRPTQLPERVQRGSRATPAGGGLDARGGDQGGGRGRGAAPRRGHPSP